MAAVAVMKPVEDLMQVSVLDRKQTLSQTMIPYVCTNYTNIYMIVCIVSMIGGGECGCRCSGGG